MCLSKAHAYPAQVLARIEKWRCREFLLALALIFMFGACWAVVALFWGVGTALVSAITATILFLLIAYLRKA